MKYVLVGGLYQEHGFTLCFNWIVQKPTWKTEPTMLGDDLGKALTFDDPQSARDFAKEFGKNTSIKYSVFTIDNVLLHQVMDS